MNSRERYVERIVLLTDCNKCVCVPTLGGGMTWHHSHGRHHIYEAGSGAGSITAVTRWVPSLCLSTEAHQTAPLGRSEQDRAPSVTYPTHRVLLTMIYGKLPGLQEMLFVQQPNSMSSGNSRPFLLKPVSRLIGRTTNNASFYDERPECPVDPLIHWYNTWLSWTIGTSREPQTRGWQTLTYR
jgi:hypothetical protein